ncbi:MAG: hypothetical protein VYA80_06900 [Pseudomonadota bacterium]|nr:hypothetical protein [Pseudomonadota bacterium]
MGFINTAQIYFSGGSTSNDWWRKDWISMFNWLALIVLAVLLIWALIEILHWKSSEKDAHKNSALNHDR